MYFTEWEDTKEHLSAFFSVQQRPQPPLANHSRQDMGKASYSYDA